MTNLDSFRTIDISLICHHHKGIDRYIELWYSYVVI